MTFAVEPWATYLPDAKKIWPQHWKELAVNQEAYQIDCDEERFGKLAELGILQVFTARDGEKLVGYIMALIMPHLHYKSAGPMAITDMYYVLPEYRNGVGMRLFQFFERELRSKKVVAAITSCKVHQDHTKFFKLMGWNHTDNTFIKLLKG